MVPLAAPQNNQPATSYLLVALGGIWTASKTFQLRRKKMAGAALTTPTSLRALAVVSWLLVAASIFLVVAAVLLLTVGPM